VPPNTSARVYLPASSGTTVTEGGQPVPVTTDGDSYVVEVGSGTWEFSVQ